MTPEVKTYRLTPQEYTKHLQAHDDPSPRTTRAAVYDARPNWIVDGAHGTASYDSEGWYWVRTSDLRVRI